MDSSWTEILTAATAVAAAASAFAALLSARSAAKQTAVVAEQTRLAVFPPVECAVRLTEAGLVLRLANPGPVPALDVDVWLVAALHENYLSIAEFRDRYVPPGHADGLLSGRPAPDEDGHYGVCDLVSHSYLGPQCEVSVPLPFPFEVPYLIAFLQFRDMAGRNYSRLASFNPSRTLGDQGRWGAASYHDGGIRETERIDVTQGRDGCIDSDSLPPFFDVEFGGLFAGSVFVGLLIGVDADIEDRGVIRDLRR